METLIKGGHVLTMDESLGEFPMGDVLIEESRIKKVATSIEAPRANVIDASGCVVAPGLVDGHRHVWQSLLKGEMSNASLPEYMIEARSMFCGCFDAEDAYVANYVGGLESIEAGITTVVDHCHLQSSPEIARALASGLLDSGIGGIFCYALQNVPQYLTNLPTSAEAVRELLMSMPDAWHEQAARDVREQILTTGEGRLKFGIALPEATPYLPATYSKQVFDRATALQPYLITGHWNASYRDGKYISTFGELAAQAVFSTPTLLAHCNQCSDADLTHMAKLKVGLCTCGTIEAGMGLGPMLAFKYRDLGGNAAAGLDITSYSKADLFAEARLMLQAERRDRAARGGGLARSINPGVREALHLLTLGGAKAIGLESETGSITPGKRADVIVVLPGGALGVPSADPAAALLFYTDPANIKTVVCSGVVRKLDGKLTGIDERQLSERSSAARQRVRKRYSQLSREMMNSAWQGMF